MTPGDLLEIVLDTVRDIVPIVLVLVLFQRLVLRERLPNPARLLQGFGFVLAGLVCFLLGLELAIFPVGRSMAAQLTAPDFLGSDAAQGPVSARAYAWVYAFAFAIGFSTTIAEPALIAVARKAAQLSGGGISALGLRIAVALGVAIGVSVGVLRIVAGLPLHYFIGAGYVFVVIQTLFAPKLIVPLAYDSGGVTTSTVTVPLVAAVGLGLAEAIPGRSPLIDGFGLIAFASLFPMITVMAYAQASAWRAARSGDSGSEEIGNPVPSEGSRP